MTPSAAGTRLTPWLDRLLEVAVGGFAVWTLAYHLGVWWGVPLRPILAAALIGTLAVGRWWWSRPAATPSEAETPVPWRAAVPALVGMVSAVGCLLLEWDLLFWFVAVGSLTAAVWAGRGERPAAETSPEGDHPAVGGLLVLGVAVLAALVSLTTRDWAPDNTYYVDRMWAVAEADGAIPVGRDTLFGDGLYPATSPENDLGSFEALVGAAAAMTPVHPMSLLSFVFQPLVLFLGTLALWRLARALGSRRPGLVAAAGMVGCWLVWGHTNVAIVMFSSRTGRSAVVAWLLPAFAAFLLEALRRGRNVDAARTAAAAIGAVGATLTGVLVVPIAAAGVLAAAWPDRSRRWRPLFVAGAVASVHAIGIVLASASLGRNIATRATTVEEPPGAVWQLTLGRLHLYLVLTVLLLAAWAVVAERAGRRFIIWSLLATMVLGLSPPALWVLGRSGAADALIRVGWTVPVGMILGLAVAGVVSRWRHAGWAAVAAAAVALVVATPRLPLPDAATPRWDVPPRELRAATRLIGFAPTDGVVAAPWDVAVALTIVDGSIIPVATQPRHVLQLGRDDPSFLLEERQIVTSWLVTGSQGRDRAAFVAALAALDVDAVCSAADAASPELRRAMRAAGFSRVGRDITCHYWVRQPAT